MASSQHTCYNRTDAWNTTPSIVVLKTDILTLHDQKTKNQKSVDGKCTKKNFVTWITRHTQNVAWLGAIILLFKPSVPGLNKLHVYMYSYHWPVFCCHMTFQRHEILNEKVKKIFLHFIGILINTHCLLILTMIVGACMNRNLVEVVRKNMICVLFI